MESGRKSVVRWVLVAAAAILVIGLVAQVVLRDNGPSADSTKATDSLTSVRPTDQHPECRLSRISADSNPHWKE